MAKRTKPKTTLQIPTTNRMSVCDLPVEILDYIFSYLSIKERIRTELVCRQWRQIGQTLPWTWPTKFNDRELKEDYRKNITTSYILPTILSRCGGSLNRLTVVYSNFKLKDKVLSLIGEHCPNLVDLRVNLRVENYGPELVQNFINLAKGCTRLKAVRLESLHGSDDVALEEFLKLCPSLEYLVLWNFTLSEELVKTFNKKLKGFYLRRCCTQTFTTVIKALMERCDSIEGLGLINCTRHYDFPMTIDLMNCYKNTLKTLYLGQCDGNRLTAGNWPQNTQELLHLEVLSLTYCSITDDSVKLIVKHCKQLRALDISHCQITDAGISYLADAPLLRVLDVSGIPIAGEGLKYVIQEGRLEKLCMKCVHPRIPHCVPDNCRVHDCYLEKICILLANYCPNLRLLVVVQNKCITNRLVHEFTSSLGRGFLEEVVTLYVGSTEVSTDVKHCDKLHLSFLCEFLVGEFDHLRIDHYRY